VTIHFAGIALIMLGGGIAALIVGGVLTMTFDISDWLPVLGGALAFCGAVSAMLAVGIQVGAWAGIH
jgi:hypothetical protein